MSEAVPGDEGEPRRVRVLSDALSNQIAAGEVVERPASVVKELVENAIDAGATRVLVDLEEAGRGLVRVVDDGVGMSAEDASLAVLRHATSKIARAEDLEAIGTLGFRGEALPSIASVSRFSLVTRRESDEAATSLRIEGGSAPLVEQAAAPVGTRIEVRDLFWNVPARLKFLKSDHTETQHVVELVKSFALGYPHIHFRLGTHARTALDFPAVRKLFERVVQVLGREAGRRLFEVSLREAQDDRRADHSAIRVSGFVSSAREAKATLSALTLFVNGRRVRDRTLTHAVVSAFGSELAPGRFPQAVLWVHLDPRDVDVNVHPAKAEVRFRRPQEVHEAVVRAIQAMLVQRPWIDASPLPLERHSLGVPHPVEPALPLPQLIPLGERERPLPTGEPHRTELAFGPRAVPIAGVHLGSAIVPRAAPSSPAPTARIHAPAPPRTEPPARWHLVGRARTLIVAEGPGGLALLDPKVAFEALTREALGALPRPIASQPLLIPARLDLAPAESQRLASCATLLASLGVEVAPFGGTTWQLLGLPQPALTASPSATLGELAAVVGKRDADDAALIAVLARQAAAGAMARGLDDRQLTALVDFIPIANGRHAGVLVLSEAEIARRLLGAGVGGG